MPQSCTLDATQLLLLFLRSATLVDSGSVVGVMQPGVPWDLIT